MEPRDGRTVDAFHRGAFHLVQPVRGHRSGMDAMVLAAAVPGDFAGRVVDLGAGAGAAGLAVLSRCDGATAVLVEREPDMIDCARMTLALPENAALASRAEVLCADAAIGGRARTDSGLADRSFDFAIMNPPFNEAVDRTTPDPLRHAAHVMAEGMWNAWLRTAAAIVRPRGGLALIARPQSLTTVLAACENRFGGARVTMVHARGEADAIRFVLRAVRGSRAGIAFAPPLVLHENGSDRFSARADAINDGQGSLFGD